MRDQYDGAPPLVLLPEQAEDDVAVLGVQIPGRFVGKQQTWIENQRTRDRHTLLFPAGQRGYGLIEKRLDLQRRGKLPNAAPLGTARIQRRQQDILAAGERRDQIVALKDKADIVEAQLCVIGMIAYAYAVEDVLAAVVAFQKPEDIQKRRFSRAGLADDRNIAVPINMQVDILQHRSPIAFPDMPKFDGKLIHAHHPQSCGSPRRSNRHP